MNIWGIRIKLKKLFSNEVVRGSFLSLFLKCLATVLGFILNVLITRTLSPSEAGYFFMAQSLVLILAVISRLGLDQIITKKVASWALANQWLEINRLYAFSVILVFFSSSMISFFVYVNSEFIANHFFNKPFLSPVLVAMIASVIPISLYMVHGQFFQGLKDMAKFQLSQGLGISAASLFLIGLVFMLTYKVDAILYAQLFTSSAFLILIIMFRFWLKSEFSEFKFGGDLKRVALEALPLWGAASLLVTQQWASVLLIGVYGTEQDAAYFSVAHRTSMLAALFLISVNSIAAPKMAAYFFQKDFLKLKHLTIWSTRLMVVVSLPVVSILFFFPERVLRLFGDGYVVASKALMILAAGQFINAMSGAVGLLLTMTNNQNIFFWCNLATVCILLLLSILLIPDYGTVGSALAYVGALCFQMSIMTYFVYRKLDIIPFYIFQKLPPKFN